MVRYLRSANVLDGALDLTDVKEMNFGPSEQAVFALRYGDVVVTEGSGSRDTVGTSTVWRDELPPPVCFQNTVLRLRPRAGLADGRYLAWWARHARAAGLMAATASGANILHLSAEALRRLPVPDVDLPRQRQIADFLDGQIARIDKIIATRAKQIELLADWWASRASECIFAVGGAVVELRRVLLRPPDYGANAAAEYENPEWPRYIRTTDVTSDGNLRPETFRSLPPGIAAHYLLSDGDLLFTRSGATVGKSFIYRRDWGPAAFAGYLIRLRADRNRVMPEWIKFFSETPEYWRQIYESSIQATIPNVNADKYASLRVSIPTLSVQRATITALNDEAASLRAHTLVLARSIQLNEEWKRSLITAAVTGEFDTSSADGSRVPA